MTFELEAEIAHVEYKPLMCKELEEYTMEDIRSGDALESGRFVIDTGVGNIAVSRWVTPKRTRSYPYARVYDTLQYPNRATIIPLVKDEGKDGDRDYLQWDTVSLMSLLNVYVIPAYYHSAEKNTDYENKITNQKLDKEYIANKLEQLQNYQGDALHWNMREMENIDEIADKCRECYYDKIAEETGVELKSLSAFDRKMESITEEVETFKEESRKTSERAQGGESSSEQPDEKVLYEKGAITLRNFLGGKYHFTVDEVIRIEDTIVLIEKKHTGSSTLPSESDIKDGLLKLALYTNVAQAIDDGEKQFDVIAGLGITSSDLHGQYTRISDNLNESGLKDLYKNRLKSVFDEGKENNFVVFASHSSIYDEQQGDLLSRLLETIE